MFGQVELSSGQVDKFVRLSGLTSGLGLLFGTLHKHNYEKLLKRIDDTLNAWHNRILTPIGKITVVNSLVNSLVINKLLALPSPKQWFFDEYRRKIVKFIWNGKHPK